MATAMSAPAPAAAPITRAGLLGWVRRLLDEVQRLEAEADYWWLRAHYSEDEIREMYLRASQGIDEEGRWLWPDGERTSR